MKSVTYRFFLIETVNMKTIAASNYTLEFDGVFYVTLRCYVAIGCIVFLFSLLFVICNHISQFYIS